MKKSFIRRDKSYILEKTKEAFSSVLPVTVIVLVLSFILIPVNNENFLTFICGSALVIVGIGLFTLDADVDKGNTDLVMYAAREAGASGGTVVKAKGTGAEIAKVFGMTISEEKEMIYIVSDREKRNDIMYAIMEKAGPNTDAHGIVFSLPVDNILGIKGLEKLFN